MVSDELLFWALDDSDMFEFVGGSGTTGQKQILSGYKYADKQNSIPAICQEFHMEAYTRSFRPPSKEARN
jgi:hypothetical protein